MLSSATERVAMCHGSHGKLRHVCSVLPRPRAMKGDTRCSVRGARKRPPELRSGSQWSHHHHGDRSQTQVLAQLHHPQGPGQRRRAVQEDGDKTCHPLRAAAHGDRGRGTHRSGLCVSGSGRGRVIFRMCVQSYACE